MECWESKGEEGGESTIEYYNHRNGVSRDPGDANKPMCGASGCVLFAKKKKGATEIDVALKMIPGDLEKAEKEVDGLMKANEVAPEASVSLAVPATPFCKYTDGNSGNLYYVIATEYLPGGDFFPAYMVT